MSCLARVVTPWVGAFAAAATAAAVTLPLAPRRATAGEKVDVPPADISAVKDKLKVLTDGKRHFVAVVPFGPSEHLYYGDGTSFYAQRVFGSSSSGSESFDFTFWEPRVKARYQASFEFREGKFRVQCQERKTELHPLPDEEARALLDRARFFAPRWRHRAHALARNERGTYYYVDRLREPEDSKSFRIFAGPKGSTRPLKMINVVSDSEGEVFATRSGDLRLVLARNEAVWVQKKTRTRLIPLPVEDNHVLIYSDLGVYTGQRLGTPCDDL
jgi:hypothetical protein